MRTMSHAGIKCLLGCLLVAGLFSPVRGENGATSADFLRVNLSARQVAMGGMFAAISDQTGSVQTNPAGLAGINRPEINLSYVPTREQSRHAYTAYAFPLRRRGPVLIGLGIGFSHYTAGNIDINSTDGTTRSFNAETAYQGIISLAARFHDVLSIGISPKFVRSELVEQFSATAYAADIGAMLHPFPKLFDSRLTLGVAFRNLGTKMTYRSVEEDLPETKAYGFAIRMWDDKDYGSAMFSAQGEKVLGEETRFRMGGEYSLGGEDDERAFFLRGGIRMQFESEDYSIGVGIREKNYQLDYAFVNGIDLDKTHLFTLIFRFGEYRRHKEKSYRYQLLDIMKEEAQGEDIQFIDTKTGKAK